MKTWKRIERGIYRQNATGTLYERPWINGVRTYRSLETSKLSEARETLSARRTDQKRAELGLAKSPYERPTAQTVGEITKRYVEDGYPDRRRSERPEVTRRAEARNCEILLEWWKGEAVQGVNLQACDRYADWRKRNVKKDCSGNRTIDLELNTLGNAFLWAWRCGLVKTNPLAIDRPRYTNERSVQHCRKFKAENADELHEIVRSVFKPPIPEKMRGTGYEWEAQRRAEASGWAYLLQNMTGLRVNELLRLHVDARPGEAGFISENWTELHVIRSKGQESVNP